MEARYLSSAKESGTEDLLQGRGRFLIEQGHCKCLTQLNEGFLGQVINSLLTCTDTFLGFKGQILTRLKKGGSCQWRKTRPDKDMSVGNEKGTYSYRIL